MTPAKRLAIGKEARLAWTHSAEHVNMHIEQGWDEAHHRSPEYHV
jgi:hypothetical protein